VDLPADYMNVVKTLVTERLRVFEIRFTNIIATPNNLLLIGYPTVDGNYARDDTRLCLRQMGYPLFEPYKSNTFHMTLVRFVAPLTSQEVGVVNSMVAEVSVDQTLAVLRVQGLSVSPCSWKMQNKELSIHKLTSFNLTE